MQKNNIKQSVKTVIVGGGAIGLSVASHLGTAGHNDVMLLERNELTSGTSWHAAGIIGPLRTSLSATRLAAYAPEYFRYLEEVTNQSAGYQQTGGIWLAQTPAREIEIKRIAALGQSLGFGIETLTNQQLVDQHNWINPDGILCGLWVEEDGQANPVDVCMAMARAARQQGVTIRQGIGVQQLNNTHQGYRLTLDNNKQLDCENLIVCAGLWSGVLLQQLGINLPLQAVEHMYVVTEAISELPSIVPITRDLDAGIYCKGDAGKLVVGGFEPNAKLLNPKMSTLQAPYALFDEDWQQFAPFIEAGLHRFPALGTVSIRQFLNGPESFTHDTQPLLGPVPGHPGLLVAAGMNSLGIVSAPGIGKSIAEWLLEGSPEWDLLAQDVARADPQISTPIYIQQRMKEAVANQFDMHWPYKQLKYGRGAKRLPAHHLQAETSAVFGNFAGWERPMWFASDSSEQQLEYSYAEQNWWSAVEREAKALQHSCGLMDLSPFSKIAITGANALAFIQKLCTRDMNLKPGKACYCLILNQQAGIIADVTITRLADHEYLIISAAAAHFKLLDWIQQQITDHQVQIEDRTQQEAVFAIAGPNSRALLQTLTDTDLSNSAFRFGEVKTTPLELVNTRIARLSFVGELGYEIYCPTACASYLYERLLEVGETFGLQQVGMFCIDACRIEKGFVHWGHDIGPVDNPKDANLMFAVSPEKTDFVGKAALDQIQATKSLVVLEVISTQEKPLLLHDEPIYMGLQVVGHTTSGVLGGRSRKALCMAYLQYNATGQLAEEYQINIAGKLYPVRVIESCIYDPENERLKG